MKNINKRDKTVKVLENSIHVLSVISAAIFSVNMFMLLFKLYEYLRVEMIYKNNEQL